MLPLTARFDLIKPRRLPRRTDAGLVVMLAVVSGLTTGTLVVLAALAGSL